MNLPNKITVLRILLVPVVLFFVYHIESSLGFNITAIVLFLAVSLTDTLDGHIARSRNLVTDFGKFLDPLADKILVISTMVVLIDLGYLSSIAVIIVIIREFVVTSLRLVASSSNLVIAASMWGKAKTVTQMVVIILLMLTPMLQNISCFGVIAQICTWCMVLITLYSGIDYLVKNKHVLNEK